MTPNLSSNCLVFTVCANTASAMGDRQIFPTVMGGWMFRSLLNSLRNRIVDMPKQTNSTLILPSLPMIQELLWGRESGKNVLKLGHRKSVIWNLWTLSFFFSLGTMGILEKIQDIETEIKRTQKNKGWYVKPDSVGTAQDSLEEQRPSTILVCSRRNSQSTECSF